MDRERKQTLLRNVTILIARVNTIDPVSTKLRAKNKDSVGSMRERLCLDDVIEDARIKRRGLVFHCR